MKMYEITLTLHIMEENGEEIAKEFFDLITRSYPYSLAKHPKLKVRVCDPKEDI